ncbi:hypothetical protein Syun_025485 [Stephania yunnanensis]|uniref:Uncharacterized protein n=1 Tax=Stephania yunnanensis TaxID=152371 RepID=A0AAP0ERR2_9MAGN
MEKGSPIDEEKGKLTRFSMRLNMAEMSKKGECRAKEGKGLKRKNRQGCSEDCREGVDCIKQRLPSKRKLKKWRGMKRIALLVKDYLILLMNEVIYQMTHTSSQKKMITSVNGADEEDDEAINEHVDQADNESNGISIGKARRGEPTGDTFDDTFIPYMYPSSPKIYEEEGLSTKEGENETMDKKEPQDHVMEQQEP